MKVEKCLTYCYLICIALIWACEDDAYEGEIPPGVANLYLQAEPWQQDSLESVSLHIEKISLEGAQGTVTFDQFSGNPTFNLLDFQQNGITLGKNVPAATYTSYSITLGMLPKTQEGQNQKVTICHIPSGNPSNAQTINIHACSVPAHTRNHDDYLGPCNSAGIADNRGLSFLEYNDGTIEMLFGDQATFSGPFHLEIVEGDTTDVAISLDLAQSVIRGELPRNEEVDCGYVHEFVPVINVKVLPRKGGIKGNYEGRMSPGKDYIVYLYAQGDYTNAEADRRDPFPNALTDITLDEKGEFTLEGISASTYELVLAETFRGRFMKIVGHEENVVITAHKTSKVKIEEIN